MLKLNILPADPINEKICHWGKLKPITSYLKYIDYYQNHF